MRQCVCIAGIVFMLFACSGGEKSGRKILTIQKMDSVMWDMMSADVLYRDVLGYDSASSAVAINTAAQAAILKKYQVSRADYFATLDYYTTRSNLFIPLLDTMLKHHLKDTRKFRMDTAKLRKLDIFNINRNE